MILSLFPTLHFIISPHFLSRNILFVTEKGFAINANYEPFKAFNIWDKKTFLQNDLAPLRPIIAFVIKQTLSSMNRFVGVLSKEIKFPEDIAPGYRVFLRGPHICRLVRLNDYIKDRVWDYDCI